MAGDLIGRTLGRYQITALVGRGGMATVYKARHPGLEQTVAVKVLHAHIATDPDMLRRFQQEAQAVANLRHPNIVRVVDFDFIDDAYFMVMEYVDGPTLAGHLAGLAAQGRRMSPEEAVRVFEPLCSAVDYAHGQGMVHRDIKPSNVLLTPQGDPVLTDYGIAKIVGVTQHTATGTVMGSAYYMSPEQAQGTGVDGRSDIYSLGVMLFEVLTGQVPYGGDTLATVLVKHITAPVPAVCALNDALPPLLDHVMNVALAKDPGERFQTGQALAAAMRQGLLPHDAGNGSVVQMETRVEPAPGAASEQGFTRLETPVPAAPPVTGEPRGARTLTSDVFISYAARDKETADAVCAALEDRDLECWMAPRDVLPGQSFAQALASAIHAARVFVLVFSSATNESQQVERELDMAVASGVPILPLRVEAVRPRESIEYYLAGQHWLDAITPPLESHLARLSQAITVLLRQTPAATGTHEPAAPGSETAARPVQVESGATAGLPVAEPEPVAAAPESPGPIEGSEPVVASAFVTAPTESAPELRPAEPPAAEPEPELQPEALEAASVTHTAEPEPTAPSVEETAPLVEETTLEPVAAAGLEPEAAAPEAAAPEREEAAPETPAGEPGVPELEPEAFVPTVEAEPEPTAPLVEETALEPEPEAGLEPAAAAPEVPTPEQEEAAVETPSGEPEAPEGRVAPPAPEAAEPPRDTPGPDAAPAMTAVEVPPEASGVTPAAEVPGTIWEAVSPAPTTYEPPSPEPTTYEPPSPPEAAHAEQAPAAPAVPTPASEVPEAPVRKLGKAAFLVAAGIGVAWVVILVAIDKLLR